ncbi:hypothetical protein TWF730_006999 [Orbilia blumenaviensis]|uniref:Uncharacterized protein n=1 Tax=Orbilia blumenaviensis TaxID=1796055 RepID=A0AAV9VFY5_9PEZI
MNDSEEALWGGKHWCRWVKSLVVSYGDNSVSLTSTCCVREKWEEGLDKTAEIAEVEEPRNVSVETHQRAPGYVLGEGVDKTE